MKKYLAAILVLLILASAGYVSVRYYSYVFAKQIQGEILKVERVSPPEAILMGGRNISPAQMFSFAIAVRDEKGVIHTASSEDRQWAVASQGQCVIAKFFPYPPWNFEKSGTYYGARLVQLYDCKNPAH